MVRREAGVGIAERAGIDLRNLDHVVKKRSLTSINQTNILANTIGNIGIQVLKV
jgi:hypothetical protein